MGRPQRDLAGRKLRLLRAHGLIYKVTGTHRYQLTKAGRIATTAILTALRSSVRQLTAAAAWNACSTTTICRVSSAGNALG